MGDSASVKKVVYLGYSPVSAPPLWIDSLCKEEQGDPSCPYLFFLSGGRPTDELKEHLLSETSLPPAVSLMCAKMAGGYAARLIPSLLSSDFGAVSSLPDDSPLSSEFRLLLDLWVLSRSSAFCLDVDVPGYGGSGASAAYASGAVPILGVCDSVVLDPWYQCYADLLTKSSLVRSSLDLICAQLTRASAHI